VEEIVEDEGVGQQGIYNNCRFYGNIICYITFISLLKINYFNYFFYILCMQKKILKKKWHGISQVPLAGHLKISKKKRISTSQVPLAGHLKILKKK